MTQEYDVKGMTARIETLRQTATELKTMSGGIQAINRNVDRVLASIKMLEINISDIASIIQQ